MVLRGHGERAALERLRLLDHGEDRVHELAPGFHGQLDSRKLGERACEPRGSLVAVRLREARVAARVGDQESEDLRSHGRAGSVSHLVSYETRSLARVTTRCDGRALAGARGSPKSS